MRILHWFRKDLRLDDNTALAAAVRDAAGDVVPFYASDPAWFARPDMAATRVRFALDSLAGLSQAVAALGSRLALDHGDPAEVLPRAARAAGADAVYWNDEYEPALVARDRRVEAALLEAGVQVRRFHDRLLVPPGAVLTRGGGPYTVYSPFRRSCEAHPIPAPHARVDRLAAHALPSPALATLARLHVAAPGSVPWPAGESSARARLAVFLAAAAHDPPAGLAVYASQRDVPAAPATSRLSADLKFGTLGVRRVAQAVQEAGAHDSRLAPHAARFVEELRWRDFFAHVLWHFPHVEHGAFRREYDALRWRGREDWFAAWGAGSERVTQWGSSAPLASSVSRTRVYLASGNGCCSGSGNA